MLYISSIVAIEKTQPVDLSLFNLTWRILKKYLLDLADDIHNIFFMTY
jgi:hypothetical protein